MGEVVFFLDSRLRIVQILTAVFVSDSDVESACHIGPLLSHWQSAGLQFC